MKECIFCGGQPVTDEHLWPDWLRPYLGGDVVHRYRHGTVGGGRDRVAEWEAPAATKTAPLLCENCNRVWAGEGIEVRSKPVLLPMILEEKERILSTDDQGTISLWACKTAMVFDRSYGKGRAFIPDDHLRLVRSTDEPPPGTVIWLAAYGLTGRVAMHTSFPFPNPDASGYGASLSVGHLVMQILNCPGTEDVAIGVLEKESRAFTVRVWPRKSESVVWPPPYSVDDDGLDALSFPFGKPPPP